MSPSGTRLPPAEWFPAGVEGITVRRVPLAGGLTLRVLEAGPPTGPAVLLVHGWAVSAYLWRHNILPLAAAGYRVIAPDLPGHGLSDAPSAAGSYTEEAFARSVIELLDACEVERAVVAGQSMGGKVVVRAALDAPARISRLVLFGPVGFGLIPPWQALSPLIPTPPGELIAKFIPREVIAFVQQRVYGKLGFFTERDVDEYWAPTQFPAVVRAQFQMLQEFRWGLWDAATLHALHQPTHVVFGTRDRTVRPRTAEELARELPNGRLTWIEDGGHVVMEEVAGRVNELLLGELRGG
ncbi:MAG: alpha/beta fold hydrolase [Gemmatimonadaceae bacterium]|nr:alpha/beta fold hydrolase [Gemmatimonadaceae bacterium]MCW5827530.1 alpha/beta fold hydrolase [Gemmatimonadaceae bacterium]